MQGALPTGCSGHHHLRREFASLVRNNNYLLTVLLFARYDLRYRASRAPVGWPPTTWTSAIRSTGSSLSGGSQRAAIKGLEI